MSPVYKILSTAEWTAAQAAGRFEGSEVDHRDGYIHLSAADQWQETQTKWFAGRDDLVLLVVDPSGLDIRLEPSRGGALFPHLYGPLPVAAVLDSRPLEPTGAG